MKWLRILLSIIGLIILIGVIAITCLVFFLDPNKLKPVIIKEVQAKTGYQLAIDGNLSWSFYPVLGVKVNHMTLTAPKQSAPFLDIKKLTIASQFSQLLHGVEKLQGDIYISEAVLNNLHVTNVKIAMHWLNAVLQLNPLTADLYNGSLTGTAKGQQLSNNPKWNWNVQFKQVQLKNLLQDLSGQANKLNLSGLADGKMSASTAGNNTHEIIGNLNGVITLNVNNGILEGVDLNYILNTADALLNKQPVPQPPNDNQTNFNSFGAAFLVKNGVLTTNNLALMAPAFFANGNGSIDLNSQGLNMQLQLKPQANARTQWEIPVIIAGSFNKPTIDLDRAELEKFIAKQELQKVKEKIGTEIQKNIPGKAGEFLQNLLK